MAASYISVPRDLTKVKSKDMFRNGGPCRSTVILFIKGCIKRQCGSDGNDGSYDALLFLCNV